MSNIEQQLTEFKLELGKEWRMLQTHKWRRPKWVKFPRAALDDPHWIKLSADAKAAWISILLIASERADSALPDPAILYRRLRALGNCYALKKFEGIILELIQCGYLTKTSPELQSYRVSELQSPLLRKASPSGDAPKIEDKRLGEEEGKQGLSDKPKSEIAQCFRDARKLGDYSAGVVGAAINKWDRSPDEIREAIDAVRDNGGDASELAHDLYRHDDFRK